MTRLLIRGRDSLIKGSREEEEGRYLCCNLDDVRDEGLHRRRNSLIRGSRLPYKGIAAPLQEGREKKKKEGTSAAASMTFKTRVRIGVATPLSGGHDSLIRGSRLPYKRVMRRRGRKVPLLLLR
jgi:hypothetical protein